jgi:hypothetical protein
VRQSDKTFWTVPELAKVAGVTDARIRQLLLGGRLAGFKHGPMWVITNHEAQRYLKSRQDRHWDKRYAPSDSQ